MVLVTVIARGEGELGSFWLYAIPHAGELLTLEEKAERPHWRVFAVHHKGVPITAPGTSGAMPRCYVTVEPASRLHVALVFVEPGAQQRTRIVADAGMPLAHALAALPLSMHPRLELRLEDGTRLDPESTPAALELEQEQTILLTPPVGAGG